MIKNPRNKNNSGSEAFDIERLEWIAERAKAHKGTNGMSDFECFVYELMHDLVVYSTPDEDK